MTEQKGKSEGVSSRAIIWGMTVALAFACAGCAALPTYRYRLTVEIDTPEGLQSSSTVIEVSNTYQRLPGFSGAPSSLRGEAVVVDLGARGILFALLRSTDEVDWAKSLYAYLTPPTAHDSQSSEWSEVRQNILARKANKRLIVLPRHLPLPDPRLKASGPSGYPVLVTFGNRRDPLSIKVVDPDHLDKNLGDGVKLKRITVQITDESLQSRISHYLPWLDRIGKEGIKIPSSERSFIYLNPGNFKKG